VKGYLNIKTDKPQRKSGSCEFYDGLKQYISYERQIELDFIRKNLILKLANSQ
jgi:hypothetical protein